MVSSDQTQKLLVFGKIKGIGPAALRRAIADSNFIHKSYEDLICDFSSKKISENFTTLISNAQFAADEEMEDAKKFHTNILSPFDIEYPSLLSSTPDAPPILYCRGNLQNASENSVAIIGTRKPTDHGKIIAERITEMFSTNNWTIVSGLALGCDSIAHQTAVNKGGHTIAVLGHGLHMIYPKSNTKLAHSILDSGGALVSEYGFKVDVISHQLVKRDRIQAGLAMGVVMVQSDEVGGSLHASRAAIQYDRILAVPQPTNLDIFNEEEKIKANLILISDNTTQKEKLLKCKNPDLGKIFVIRSLVDYDDLLKSLKRHAYLSIKNR